MDSGRTYQKVTLENGEKIHYQEMNEDSTKPEVIMFVHGNLSNEAWWNDVMDEMKVEGYRMIALDLRGFGQSTYQGRCTKFEHWASDVVDLCNLLKIQKVILNGWSFGGPIVMKAAELAPELVGKLILTCSGSIDGLVLKDEEGKEARTEEEVQKHRVPVTTSSIIQSENKELMKAVFDKSLFIRMNDYPEQKRQILLASPFKERCYLDTVYALANSDINGDKIKAEAFIIHGLQDPILPPETILKTCAKLGKLELWEKGAHMMPLEDTPRYVKSILQFIKS